MQTMGQDSINLKRAYRFWRKCMAWGERTGCHQMPERSFFYKGYQMPICARCTGVMIGYILATPIFLLFGFYRIISLGGAIGMLIDWLLQTCKIKPSTNKRRLLTGIAGGFGIMSIQLYFFRKILRYIR